ncbi:MAG: hypothetical protein CMF96_01070 [Candidatus Marinimicrobia bacterium]|nr:hypothetical protein [Candidatus Neomarinimicrobiota bacterium]|tara:strand:- start:6872 stop:7207 length:336 start_codon:yes stop_codon:yes gene_type:complete
MDNEFKELTKSNLPSESINSGKLIKGTKVKLVNSARKISNTSTKVDVTHEPIDSSNEKIKNQFTVEPKYNEDIIEELCISCSCGNHTRIVFNNEENFTDTKNLDDESISEN